MATRLPTQSWQDALDRLYTLEEPEEIRTFLDAHPKLIGILIDAHEQIVRSFGTTTAVRIRYYIDPEDPPDDAASLGVTIASPHDVEAALLALDTFNERW